MSDLEARLKEDKALRDTARQIVAADLAQVKGDTPERSIARRAADGVSETSFSLADRALGYATANPLLVGGGLIAVLLFVLRGRLAELLFGGFDRHDDDGEGDGAEPSPRYEP